MQSRVLFSLLTAVAITGCSALTSTTNTTARALESGLQTSTQGTEATSRTDDNDRFADARAFAASQFVQLRREAAAGGGEHTRALARLLGARSPRAFSAWLQAHYADVFNEDDTQHDLVARINALRSQATHKGRRDDDA